MSYSYYTVADPPALGQVVPNSIVHGDCLEAMKFIADGSIDMVLCDLPYGTTACKWDTIIPFDELWTQYGRIIKPNGAIVLTASQPFTSALVMSNTSMFRYALVWDKVNRYTGSLNANRMPLKRHEDVLVFYKKLPVYNKQMRTGKPYIAHNTKGHGKHTEYGHAADSRTTINNGEHNPCSIVQISADNKTEMGHHPTQKPVALFEHLIRTYTNEGDTVLDNCAGSFTTAVACENTGRKWICIEQEEKYVNIGRARLDNLGQAPAPKPKKAKQPAITPNAPVWGQIPLF